MGTQDRTRCERSAGRSRSRKTTPWVRPPAGASALGSARSTPASKNGAFDDEGWCWPEWQWQLVLQSGYWSGWFSHWWQFGDEAHGQRACRWSM